MTEIAIMVMAFGGLWCLVSMNAQISRVADELKKWNDELMR